MTPAVTDPPKLGSTVRDPGSFRDPSGFVYRRDGRLFRQVNRRFADHWDALVASGFLSDLVNADLLVPFELADPAAAPDRDTAHAVIAPEPIDFLSYPYEWTFSQLRSEEHTSELQSHSDLVCR